MLDSVSLIVSTRATFTVEVTVEFSVILILSTRAIVLVSVTVLDSVVLILILI